MLRNHLVRKNVSGTARDPGKDLDTYLLKLLSERGYAMTGGASMVRVAQDIKHRVCYVAAQSIGWEFRNFLTDQMPCLGNLDRFSSRHRQSAGPGSRRMCRQRQLHLVFLFPQVGSYEIVLDLPGK